MDLHPSLLMEKGWVWRPSDRPRFWLVCRAALVECSVLRVALRLAVLSKPLQAVAMLLLVRKGAVFDVVVPLTVFALRRYL